MTPGFPGNIQHFLKISAAILVIYIIKLHLKLTNNLKALRYFCCYYVHISADCRRVCPRVYLPKTQ